MGAVVVKNFLYRITHRQISRLRNRIRLSPRSASDRALLSSLRLAARSTRGAPHKRVHKIGTDTYLSPRRGTWSGYQYPVRFREAYSPRTLDTGVLRVWRSVCPRLFIYPFKLSFVGVPAGLAPKFDLDHRAGRARYIPPRPPLMGRVLLALGAPASNHRPSESLSLRQARDRPKARLPPSRSS